MTKRDEIIEVMRLAIYKEGGIPGKLDASDLATVAFDAALGVMMEPDVGMLMAARKQTFADMTGEHCGPNAERTIQAALATLQSKR